MFIFVAMLSIRFYYCKSRAMAKMRNDPLSNVVGRFVRQVG